MVFAIPVVVAAVVRLQQEVAVDPHGPVSIEGTASVHTIEGTASVRTTNGSVRPSAREDAELKCCCKLKACRSEAKGHKAARQGDLRYTQYQANQGEDDDPAFLCCKETSTVLPTRNGCPAWGYSVSAGDALATLGLGAPADDVDACAPHVCPDGSLIVSTTPDDVDPPLQYDCPCPRGEHGKVTYEWATRLTTGECLERLCPDGAEKQDGECVCGTGYRPAAAGGPAWIPAEQDYEGGCERVECPAEAAPETWPACRCGLGLAGSVLWDPETNAFISACSPAACPAHSSRPRGSAECACDVGFDDAEDPLAWSWERQEYTGTCARLACPADSSPVTAVPDEESGALAAVVDTMECVCNHGYTGSILFDATKNQFVGACTFVPCPANAWPMENAMGPHRDCLCEPGFESRGPAGMVGPIVWLRDEQVFGGSCEPVPCPATSDPASHPDCTCRRGYAGEVRWTGESYEDRCERQACPAGSAPHTWPHCACDAGFLGALLPWDPASGFGACTAAPCPAHAAGEPHCACLPGFAADTTTGALEWLPSGWAGSCDVACPRGAVASGATPDTCACDPELRGEVHWDAAAGAFEGQCTAPVMLHAITYNAGNADLPAARHQLLWQDLSHGHEKAGLLAVGLQEHLPQYDVAIEAALYPQARAKVANAYQAEMPQALPEDVADLLKSLEEVALLPRVRVALHKLSSRLEEVQRQPDLKAAAEAAKQLYEELGGTNVVLDLVRPARGASPLEEGWVDPLGPLRAWRADLKARLRRVKRRFPNAAVGGEAAEMHAWFAATVREADQFESFLATDGGLRANALAELAARVQSEVQEAAQRGLRLVRCRDPREQALEDDAVCKQDVDWLTARIALKRGDKMNRRDAGRAGAFGKLAQKVFDESGEGCAEALGLTVQTRPLWEAFEEWWVANLGRVQALVPPGLTRQGSTRAAVKPSDVAVLHWTEGFAATAFCHAGGHYDTTLRVFVSPALEDPVSLHDQATDNYISGMECGKVVNRMVLRVDEQAVCLLNTHMSFADKVAAHRGRNMARSLARAGGAARDAGGCAATVFVGDFNSRSNCEPKARGTHFSLVPPWDQQVGPFSSMHTLLRRFCPTPGECALDSSTEVGLTDEMNQFLTRDHIRCYQKSSKAPAVPLRELYAPSWVVQCTCPEDKDKATAARTFVGADRFSVLEPAEPSVPGEDEAAAQRRAAQKYAGWAECGLCSPCSAGFFKGKKPPVCKYHAQLPTDGAAKAKFFVTNDAPGLPTQAAVAEDNLREAAVVRFPPTYRYGQGTGSAEHVRDWTECFDKEWRGGTERLCLENPAKHEDGKHNPGYTDRVLVSGRVRTEAYDWQVLPLWRGCATCDHAGVQAVLELFA